MESPLQSLPLFLLGPVPIRASVVMTWVIMVVLVLGAAMLTRDLSLTS